MRDDLPQPADPLDDLLPHAQWKDSPAALERLEHTWNSISPARRRPQRNWWPLAVAAAAMLTAGAAAIITIKRSHVVQPVPIVLVQPPTRSVEAIAPTPLMGKAPTPLQKLVIEEELARPPRLSQQQATAAIDEAIVKLSTDPATDAVALCARLQDRIAPDLLQAQLRQRVITLRSTKRAAVIQLVGLSGNEQAVGFLLPLLSDEDARQEALNAICRLADVSTFQRLLASAEWDFELRQMIAAMLRRDPAAAMPVYLQLVEDPQMRGAALDALDDLPQPPVEQLMAALRAPRISVRLAAARALGHIDGPRTTAELVALVSNNISRREALAALLYSKGDQAKAAVAAVSQSRELGAVVQAVESELQPLN